MKRSPLVIVGVGGSGTRVFARIAEAAGRHMGAVQNKSSDTLALYDLADRWCERVHRAWQVGDPPPEQSKFEAELAAGLVEHRGDAPPDAAWGWKQPRSIHLLPALDAAFPGELCVLHVIRDGRDVAFGKASHLRLTWPFTVPDTMLEEPIPILMAHIWASVNTLAARFGEGALGNRYLRVRLEDLCADPVRVSAQIGELIGEGAEPSDLRELVRTPESTGRWRREDRGTVDQVTSTAATALRRFGYTE